VHLKQLKKEIIMLEKIKGIIAEQLQIAEDVITEKSSIKEDLGADSLDLFELVLALEEAFEVEIPTEDLEHISTVQDVLNYITNKVGN